MFFQNDALSFHLIDVLELKQKNVSTTNSGRNFSALSFRFRSDALVRTGAEEVKLHDNFVAYFPARMDYVRAATVDEMIVVHFEATGYRAEALEYFAPRNPARLSALFREIYAAWCRREVGYRYKCSALLYEIFAECYAQNYTAPQQSSKIAPSVDYLLANYKNPRLTVGELAAKSYMSEVYFRRLFKEEFGVSPQKYIIRLRIQNAINLIATGYYSLAEVAFLSGYNDYKYFSVEFKRLTGVSPSQYQYNYS